MDPFQPAEMLRVPLHELCLQIKLLELGEIESFLAKARRPPPPLDCRVSPRPQRHRAPRPPRTACGE